LHGFNKLAQALPLTRQRQTSVPKRPLALAAPVRSMIPSIDILSHSLISKSVFEAPKKATIIRLRWLVITIASYVLLFAQVSLMPRDLVHAFVISYILTNASLYGIDKSRFESMHLVAPLVIFDTLALSFSLIVTDQLGSDFYLSYFLMIIIAGFWKDFRWSLGFAAVLSLLYISLLLISESLTTGLMLRAPFILIASLFYSYFVQIVNNEQALRHKAEAEARHDFLTGLANRQAFQERITLETERARRYGRPLSILMVDIDNFKLVNDALGHDAGDTVLRQVAMALQNSLRNVDFVGRFGGEEFVVILPETGLAGALDTAERARLAIRQTPVETANGFLTVTVSIGASSNLVRELTDHLQMVADADQALYLAKKNGKDCVRTLAGENALEPLSIVTE
jgi:diguanylate cyclase (GGDEF)-like protein